MELHLGDFINVNSLITVPRKTACHILRLGWAPDSLHPLDGVSSYGIRKGPILVSSRMAIRRQAVAEPGAIPGTVPRQYYSECRKGPGMLVSSFSLSILQPSILNNAQATH